MLSTSSSSSQKYSKRNQYSFSIDMDRRIEISSNFENGNISLVKQIHQLYYILEPLPDIENVQSKKTWFYFKIRSEKGIKVRLIIQNVNIYQTIFAEKYHCKPFFRVGLTGKWQQLTQSFLTYRDQIVLIIDHTFKCSEEVYICLTIPFTYSDNQQYLTNIKRNIHRNIAYDDQILTLTPDKREVHLLTITQNNKNKNIKNGNAEDKKPVILITSRVHPGEVSSSYVIQGILQFLLSYNNLQAYLLRRLFIFKIVPMLNPDGVYEGNYRMNPQGYNLNRFYLEPSIQLHPAIYQISQLMRQISSKNKIQFYFDLHSHSSIKESFIYGNALDDIVSQTYSEQFCKILQQNYAQFRYNLSNFNEKQMKFKDKGQTLSKQGCGRVVINRFYGVIQSYTVQSSIFSSSYDNFKSKKVKFQQQNLDYVYSELINNQTYAYEKIEPNFSSDNSIVAENKKLGKAILISILDMLKKNPYTRLQSNYNQSIFKQISNKLLQNEERFKLIDMKAYQKSKLITQFVKNFIEDKIDKEWNFAGIHHEINAIDWPKDFRKIAVFDQLIMKQSKTKIQKLRVRTQFRTNSLSKPKKTVKTNAPTESKINVQTHRSISPKNGIKLLPEIKYSIQVKTIRPKDIQIKAANTIKQIKFDTNQNSSVIEGEKIKKKVIIDFIQQEINKIIPDRQIFKKHNSSLNRLIAHKILEREKSKNRSSQMNDYPNIIMQSRKRMATQCKYIKGDLQNDDYKVLHDRNDRLISENDEEIKGLQLKKAEMIKKRFIATNKAIQIIKATQKGKVKLPDLQKLNLIIQNYKKEKPIFLADPEQRNYFQNYIEK